MKTNRLVLTKIEQLRRLDSCTVANAVESFEVRLRNTGFTNSSVTARGEFLSQSYAADSAFVLAR
jgi:hypothetical protein